MEEVRSKARLAKTAAQEMNRLTSSVKNEALLVMADQLLAHQQTIIAANQLDLQRERSQGMSESLLDRLALTPERVSAIAEGLRQIVDLEDPVGSVLEEYHRPNGLRIVKKRVPLGVIGIIYEARPNVTVDAIGLCLKTGNTVVLRGGSAALESNKAIVAVLRDALATTSLPVEAIQLIHSSDRASVNEMLTLNGLLDVIIPRGGAALIQNVVKNATVPVIETGAGICHTYIAADADPDMAEAIALNAKVQRPSVCNAMETLLVNAVYPTADLQRLISKMQAANVSIYGCERTLAAAAEGIQPADQSNYATEYNDYTLNVRIVDDLDQAIEHIQTYGTMHSECIVTADFDQAEAFMQRVDAAAVYHNASTRFTDGFEFGFGAEIGISTQKLHARGPMGLPALTSSKYLVYGEGQIR